MYQFFKILLITSVLTSVIFSQEKSRQQEIEELKNLKIKIEETKSQIEKMETELDVIYKKILSIDAKDIAEAYSIGASAIRLFPDGIMDKLIPAPDGTSFSEHRFSDVIEYYYAPKIIFRNGNLEIAKETRVRDIAVNGIPVSTKLINRKHARNYGFIANIGGTLIETVDKTNREVKAINKFKADNLINDFKDTFNYDGINFSQRAIVVVGNTYLVKFFQQNKGVVHVICVLKIHKKDDDGSIVLFVKTIDNFYFDAPARLTKKKALAIEKPYKISDGELYTKIQNLMTQKGFFNVIVEVKNGVVVLQGSVPKGRFGEAILLANEANPKKVVNKLTEQKN